MKSILQTIRGQSGLVFKLLPLVAFAVAFGWLYILEPATFQLLWKGRTFELFFIWLIGLELILGWEELKPVKFIKKISVRTVALITTLVLPTLYVVASYYWGLNDAISNWSIQNQITQGLAAQDALLWERSMPLALEYFVFAALFIAIVYLSFGLKGIKSFSVPAFFMVLVGLVYIIDNILPYGQFTPFQVFVPTTTNLAAAILNMMGYTTSITYSQNMPYLTSTNPHNLAATATFSIAWPCAGIESFLIFTVVILLFMKRMQISLRAKFGYFIFGVAVTYVINALRIVSIFLIGMTGASIDNFHYYYGPLYAIMWIVSYPIIILASQNLWHKIRKPKLAATEPRLPSPNPV
jgi:exosortase/archaeosortase family protein